MSKRTSKDKAAPRIRPDYDRDAWWRPTGPIPAISFAAHNLKMRPTGRDPVLAPNPGFVPTKSGIADL